MTRQELEKISFKFEDFSQIGFKRITTYHNAQYGITIILKEKAVKKGINTSRIFEYKGKRYNRISKFLEVIKDVEFFVV